MDAVAGDCVYNAACRLEIGNHTGEPQDSRVDIKSLNPVPSCKAVVFRFTKCGVAIKKSTWSICTRLSPGSNAACSQSGTTKENDSSLHDGWTPILDGVCEQVCGGSLLAIMGPSGSGKSTLLSLLTLSQRNGRATGKVTLNGHNIDSKILREHCAFVPQDDHLWPFLTCRETLSFAADFFLSQSFQERQTEVDRLLKELGLEKCANTLCGNKFLKGLSGGQKRRLSLAIALIKRPTVLFLDEPTSGLDSASAKWIVAFLKQYVKQEGVAAICTIHQPSTAIFKEFDSTMLLSGGRVAYAGPAAEAAGYFAEALATPVPKEHSPAEFVLEIVNSDFGDAQKKQEVEMLLNSWSARAVPGGRNSSCLTESSEAKLDLPDRTLIATSFLSQVLP